MTLISLIAFSQEIHGDAVFGSRTRSMLYFTSSAVIVWPLWNLTFGRSLNVYVFPPFVTSQLVARHGTMLVFSSYDVRLS